MTKINRFWAKRINHAGMDPHLLSFAERQAPRYTSYPSANHFCASVDAGLYRRWLGALSDTTNLSLYLHVPYCWYCGCTTLLTRGGDIGDSVTTLMMEMDLRRGAVIQTIMCNLEIDLGPWGGWDMFPEAHAELRPFAEAGLVEIHGDVLVVPPAARQFSRLVAMAFDAYGQSSPLAHARAV